MIFVWMIDMSILDKYLNMQLMRLINQLTYFAIQIWNRLTALVYVIKDLHICVHLWLCFLCIVDLPVLFLSLATRLSRCFLSVDCLWPLVQGMLSPAISPRCINNNRNYSHSNQSVAPASRGLSREQIDRHLKSHIDCVAKKNTHKHTLGWVWGGMGGQIVSLGRKIDVNVFGWLRKTSGIMSGQPFMAV